MLPKVPRLKYPATKPGAIMIDSYPVNFPRCYYVAMRDLKDSNAEHVG